MSDLLNHEGFELKKFTKEELAQAANFDREEILAAHGLYERIQKLRVGARNMESAHQRGSDALADPALITALKEDLYKIEVKAARVLAAFTKTQPLGRWAMSIAGCDSILASGLLAHIDVSRAVTAGGVWMFAGQVKYKQQLGQKRKHNARLKKLCWQLGSCFKRLSAFEKSDELLEEQVRKAAEKEGLTLTEGEIQQRVVNKQMRAATRRGKLDLPEYLYVKLYMQRKVLEVRRNERGELAEQAAEKLESAKNNPRVTATMRECWASGKLQPAGLDLRAMRHAVKMFLSHFWEIGRKLAGLPIVKPWPLEHGGHVHYIPPPCWPPVEVEAKSNGKPRREKLVACGA